MLNILKKGYKICPVCAGTGMKDSVRICMRCNGEGQVNERDIIELHD